MPLIVAPCVFATVPERGVAPARGANLRGRLNGEERWRARRGRSGWIGCSSAELGGIRVPVAVGHPGPDAGAGAARARSGRGRAADSTLRSVHTFGMRFELDLLFLDRLGRTLAVRRRVGAPPDRRAAGEPTRCSSCRAPRGESPARSGPRSGRCFRSAKSWPRSSFARTMRRPWSCSASIWPRTVSAPCPPHRRLDAMRLCRFKQPDLLLLDLALPDASGLDVLRSIREADGTDARFDPDLPVIVLSGRGSDAERVRGFEFGADDYLVKPFHYPELRARIGAVLRRRAGRRVGPRRVGDLVIDPARRRVVVEGQGRRPLEQGVLVVAGSSLGPGPGLLQAGAARRGVGVSHHRQDPDPRLARKPAATQARPRATAVT